jgi:hypothetical protein
VYGWSVYGPTSRLGRRLEDPFVTEVVIDSELPRTPGITISVVKPADAIIRLGDQAAQKRAPFDVVSLFSLLGLEFALGLTEGVINAVGKSREAAVESVAASIQ